MKKFTKIFFTFIILASLLSGCWNYREIERLSIIAGAAIDKGINHKYLVTMEIIKFNPGKEPEIESSTVSGEGNSILEAIRNSYNISGQVGYWNHARVFIISQDIAREGILPILDLLNRSPLLRISINILISKTKNAAEVLAAQSLNQPIRSFQLDNAFAVQQRSLSKAMGTQVYQAINAVGSEGTALILPTVGVVTNNGQPTMELSGTALFKQDRLVGLLDGEESKYVLFIRNKVQGGILLENLHRQAEPATVTLKIKENQTKLKPFLTEGKPIMHIDLKTKVDIWEWDLPANNDEKDQKLLKTQTEKALQENILRVVRKVQQNYGTDIFGFGSQVRSQMPDLWKKIKPHWEQLFKQLKVIVKSEVEIQESGMAFKALKVGG